MTTIKDVLKQKEKQPILMDEAEADAVENSPYKKREKRTTLPNVNKFTDKNAKNGINLINTNENHVNNITVNKPPSSKQVKNNNPSSNNNINKHSHNNSHNNMNTTNNSNNTPVMSLKASDYSPLIKYSNNNMNLLMKMNNNENKDFALNVQHANSSNSSNFNNHHEEKLKIGVKSAFKSKAGNNCGRTKTNQDSCLVKMHGLKLEGFNLFAVMDGHGSHGHFISNSVKALFSEYIFKASHYGIPGLSTQSNQGFTNMTSNHKNIYNNTQNSNLIMNSNYLSTVYNKIAQNEYNLIKRCFQHCEATLAKSKYEVNFSGTTAVMVIQIDDVLICGNTGDSRAIVKTTEGIKCLSIDHKPDSDGEKQRILSSGGRVEKFNDGGDFIGPYRVWLKYEDYPGLAMSRSLGDFVSKSVGCSCIPEIIELKINSTYEYMVMASDGVWEFLDNETVAKIVQPYYHKNDPEGACSRLIEEASRMWKIVS